MKIIDLSQNVILENKRAKLRPMSVSDFDALLFYSMNEPDLWKYSLTRGDGAENLTNYMNAALEDRKINRSLPFVVIDKQTNKICGSTRFYDYQSVHNTIQLGYTWYGKEYHGTGLNKNCKLLLLQHAFENWKLDRVEFRADFENKRSIAAMKSIGCIEEGVLRSNCASPTGRRDSIVLSILKDEWIKETKQKLSKKI